MRKQKNYLGFVNENRRASKKSKRLAGMEAVLGENEGLNIIENVNEINVSIEHYVLFHQPVLNQTRVKTRELKYCDLWPLMRTY